MEFSRHNAVNVELQTANIGQMNKSYHLSNTSLSGSPEPGTLNRPKPSFGENNLAEPEGLDDGCPLHTSRISGLRRPSLATSLSACNNL